MEHCKKSLFFTEDFAYNITLYSWKNKRKIWQICIFIRNDGREKIQNKMCKNLFIYCIKNCFILRKENVYFESLPRHHTYRCWTSADKPSSQSEAVNLPLPLSQTGFQMCTSADYEGISSGIPLQLDWPFFILPPGRSGQK
jgi:hypothetical protein